MEKVHEYISKVPGTLVDFINSQTAVQTCEAHLDKAEREITHFKKFRTFKISDDSDNNKSKLQGIQKAKLGILSENSIENIQQIKLERTSEIPNNTVSKETNERESLKENIKIENLEMPPPQMPVKKYRKIKKESNATSTRSTRSKASKKNEASIDSVQSRDSDVVLQKQIVETVTISDSEDEGDANSKRLSQKSVSTSDNEEVSVRTTRTKTNKKQNDIEENGKRHRSPSTDIGGKTKLTQAERKNKRKKSEESLSQVENSVYEDAEANLTTSDQNKVVNSTFVKEKANEIYVTDKIVSESNIAYNKLDETHTSNIPAQDPLSDQTIVVTNPKVIKNPPAAPIDLNDILTDDDDDDVIVTLPVSKSIKNGAKAIFSPFEGSPVKKRVEAFEKLGAETLSEIPIRTRIKTKVLREKEVIYSPKLQSGTDKQDKNVTPQMANRYLAAISNSTTKASKKLMCESFMSTKSASALKASQQEYKDRENRRKEKEAEAMKKREALILAQTEEKKKKRVEKQIKAQQTREALEKSKLKILEETERKEEKRKQLLAERQEKLKRQQEEAERKRLEVLRKAAEEKRKEEKLKQLALKKAAEDEAKRALDYKKKLKQQPRYLRERAPLLPTEDCYDSDDEVQPKQLRKPSWTSRERLEEKLYAIKYLDKVVASNFFLLDVTTPDLRDIFEYIDPRKLKRTSSANWKVPPRFTLMPETIEEDGEEDE
ncbi:hypothetical protein AMK59_6890 [Oryctes borbonicus]|uniref:Inner centromere protein ARK-binding domain-containing protein n=1 Tax=Oryctes borbonicus TaxID=1629725 RepID=A0A0T6AXW8_9SCAR|nr:hypothetical protein AMK59_6890 [Oryctes borbonicus]